MLIIWLQSYACVQVDARPAALEALSAWGSGKMVTEHQHMCSERCLNFDCTNHFIVLPLWLDIRIWTASVNMYHLSFIIGLHAASHVQDRNLALNHVPELPTVIVNSITIHTVRVSGGDH